MISALLLVLLISVSILPLNLFHNHSSSNFVLCEKACNLSDKISGQNELVSFKTENENKHEECLFCAWQIGAKLTYVLPKSEVSQEDFVKNKFTDFQLTTVEFLTAFLIPNKGPPDFLLF